MKNIVGIDPGVSGAISLVDSTGRFIDVRDLPTMAKGGKVKQHINSKALQQIIYAWFAEHGEIAAYMENIHAMPGQGVSSMFSMGDTFGAIRGVLACEGIETYFISPKSWKKELKLTSDKELCRAFAIRLFPEASQYLERKKDHNRAESLLIAKYGYRDYYNKGETLL